MSGSGLIGPVIAMGAFPALRENRNGPFLMRGTDAMTSCAADDNGSGEERT